MATTIKMPQLGESVTEGTIERWLVKEGDSVEQYDPLFEVVTDKVNAEVPAEIAGTITKIMVPDGETVAVGTPLAEIGEKGFEHLDGPVTRLAGPDVPGVPFHHNLEDWFMIGPARIVDAARQLATY